MKGSGGTDGGLFQFGIGFLLSVIAAYMLFDSVNATTGYGLFSGMMRGRQHNGVHGGLGHTTSMGIVFVPFMLGVIALFYDASKKWAWWLMYAGVAIVGIEILSHIRFEMKIKVSHLILMLGMFAAGVGLMLRSYRDTGQTIEKLVKEGGSDSAKASVPNETSKQNETS